MGDKVSSHSRWIHTALTLLLLLQMRPCLKYPRKGTKEPSYGAELREAHTTVCLDWTGFHGMPFLGGISVKYTSPSASIGQGSTACPSSAGFLVGRAKRSLSSRLDGPLDVALEDMWFEDITYLKRNRNARL